VDGGRVTCVLYGLDSTVLYVVTSSLTFLFNVSLYVYPHHLVNEEVNLVPTAM
jgi:hypothetical protein